MTASRLTRTRTTWFLGFALLLIGVFAEPLYALAVHAAHSELHSHILLVPLISAYLIYIRRELLPKDFGSAPFVAALFLVVGGAAALAALPLTSFGRELSHNDYLSLMTFSFICLLGAGGFLFLGRHWMAAMAFPFFFLIFMIPLPDRLVDSLETASKLASAEAASFFFNISGTPVLRDGTVFQLPGITIRVAQECSGIRSSYVLIITSLLAGHLFLTRTWSRILLVSFVIPLGIIRNGFRIWVISTLCIHIGPQMIHSIIHRRGGPLFFTLSLGPLFLVLWWLRLRERRKPLPSRDEMRIPASPPAAVSKAPPGLSESVGHV
jgi:exosortase C (VPDSG-CTERM-specific)